MKRQESRRRVSLMIAVGVSVALGVLFFMPWLSISFDTQALMQVGNMPEGIVLPPMLSGTMELAQTSGQQLTGGEVTITEEAKKVGTTMSDETNMPSRTWVYAGLALPGLLLLVCALGLADKISLVGAGKIAFLLAFAGVVVMYSVSRINYVDDMVNKVFEMYDEHAPAGMPASVRADMERNMEQSAESLKKVILTRSMAMLWVTMGAYAAVCVCGLVAIGSPTPASEMAITERTANAPRHDYMQSRIPTAARPSPPDRRTRTTADLSQFGPDLFAPSDRGKSDT